MISLFRTIILSLFGAIFAGASSFALIVQVPSQQGQDDLAITGPTQIQSDEGSFYDTLQLINRYLWFAISVVCMGVLVYGGFKLISAQGDEKKMQEANKLLTGAVIGIVISLASYALVRLLVNLLA